MHVVANIVSSLIVIATSIPYIRAIWTGSARPSRASWIVFLALDVITLAGMAAKNSMNGQILSGTITTTFIAGSVVLKGRSAQWEWHEKAFLVGGLFGILLWVMTHDAAWAIVISLLVIELALGSTIINVWRDPSRESAILWFLPCLASVPILLTAPNIDVGTILQPIIWLTNGIFMSLFILWRRRARSPLA